MLTLCPVIFDSAVPDHRFCKFAKNMASIPDHHLSLSNKAVCLCSWGPHTAFLQTSPLTPTPPKQLQHFVTVIQMEGIGGL